MISNRCYCQSAQRRQATFERGVLNGLDYLEVEHPAQTTLIITFLRDANTLTVANFSITGGTRVQNIHVVSAVVAANQVTLTVDRPGDFSEYILRVRDGQSIPANFDPVLCDLPFSFKVGCPSDFDCRTSPANDSPKSPREEIDYLAKDYRSFRRLMLDRLSVTMPEWTERNPADFGVALVEMLASVADELSYFQDRVGTEAYLETARRRTSVRRHVRLLDYDLDEGQAARAFVCFDIRAGSPADGAILPENTPVMDRSQGEGVIVSLDNFNQLPLDTFGFQTLHSVRLTAARSQILFHTGSDFDCRLRRGSTSATFVASPGLALAPGDLIALYEVRDPATGNAADADPDRRHVVRLTRVTPIYDPVEKVDVLDVAWDEQDALPVELIISARLDEDSLTDLSVANANVVVAEHGLTFTTSELIPPEPAPTGEYRPRIIGPSVTQAAWFEPSEARTEPAASAMHPVSVPMPQVRLTNSDGVWQANRDLLATTPFDRSFVVETEDNSTYIRFGDGRLGSIPRAGDRFQSEIRFGNGRAGNVGPGAISRIVTNLVGIEAVWNPIAASGGREPESLARARRFAPEAYQVQERCVTPDDYARRAEKFPGVQAAHAVFRWTGSWLTVYVAVDRKSGQSISEDPRFRSRLLKYLERYRMAGTDLELVDPVSVPLQITLRVCVASTQYRADIIRRLLETFSAGIRPDGQLAFFHPDRYTFGQSIYASQILAATMAIPGVDHARLDVFKRWAEAANQELETGELTIHEHEVAQCASDPDRPESGRIEFILDGGR